MLCERERAGGANEGRYSTETVASLCCTAEMYGNETNPHLLKIIFERVLLGVVVVERKLIMGVRERWLAEGGV